MDHQLVSSIRVVFNRMLLHYCLLCFFLFRHLVATDSSNERLLFLLGIRSDRTDRSKEWEGECGSAFEADVSRLETVEKEVLMEQGCRPICGPSLAVGSPYAGSSAHSIPLACFSRIYSEGVYLSRIAASQYLCCVSPERDSPSAGQGLSVSQRRSLTEENRLS